MPSHTLHVVQAFEERDGGIVPVEPKACPSAASARALAARFAQTHVGIIAWSRTGDPDLGDWGPPVVLVRTGVIPDEFEACRKLLLWRHASATIKLANGSFRRRM
jgi:hypothetical protein